MAEDARRRDGALSGASRERDRLDILGCEVDRVEVSGALLRISEFLNAGRPAAVVTFGAEMAIWAQRDRAFRDAVNDADLVVADTVGIVWASRILGKALPERIAGIELVERLLDETIGPVYFLGAADGVARTAADRLRDRHPTMIVAGTHHGYFADAEGPAMADAIRAAGARIVLVALGFPRQELWIRDNLSRVGPAVCVGVGGAFDVWAGKVARAPAFWRRAGLEWFYRLITDPRRLGRQLSLPAFAFRVLVQALFKR